MRSSTVRRFTSLVAAGAALLAAGSGAAQQAPDAGPRSASSVVSVWISGGTGISPLGEIAESYATFAIPGRGTDVRVGVTGVFALAFHAPRCA